MLARNYRTPFGEADIVARDGETVVFCEVKARLTESFGTPAEAVGADKRRRYGLIARFFQQRAGRECNVRFDVLEVYTDRVVHLKDAFRLP